MKAVEFQAKPQNGVIKIPPEYAEKINGIVRVIILTQEQHTSKTDAIDRLLEKPLHDESFKPPSHSEIYERS